MQRSNAGLRWVQDQKHCRNDFGTIGISFTEKTIQRTGINYHIFQVGYREKETYTRKMKHFYIGHVGKYTDEQFNRALRAAKKFRREYEKEVREEMRERDNLMADYIRRLNKT